MFRKILPTLALMVGFAVPDANATDYVGICEASAGAFIDPNHFAVASDETNKLRVYERGKPDPVGDEIDMKAFTSFNKSDLEAAAQIGDRVYWISSHSFTRNGEDQSRRKVFFATKMVLADGKPTLAGVGSPVTTLRDAFAKAAGASAGELNIEALAATPEGGLLIGLRAPLRDKKAVVISFKNPAAVVDESAQPEFGETVPIDLSGSGIRSMDFVGGDNPYMIVAGPVSDASESFVLFRWSGKSGDNPVKVEGAKLTGLKPEGAIAVPDQQVVQLLSDDDDLCSDEDDPPHKRKFRSIDVPK
jgi:hypothetical protein